MKGCGDHGCLVSKPVGAGTNSRCRCPEWKLQAVINQLRAENARLISAAPKLLEALEELMFIVHNTRGVDGWHLNGDTAFWGEFEEVVIAENAIAEARGEA